MIVLVSVLVLAFPGTGPTVAQAASPAEGKPPVMLLFPSGGFAFGDPSLMDPAAARALEAGFRPRSVAYLTGGGGIPAMVTRTMQLARQITRRGRDVYAYGDSAGGLLASLLAQKGIARRAAAKQPVSDLGHFIRSLPGSDDDEAAFLGVPTPFQQRIFSPNARRTHNNVLVTAAENDALSEPTVLWARRELRVGLRTSPGTHLDPAYYDQNMSSSIAWLAQQRTRLERHDARLARRQMK
ncbi:MAG TPA: hypothetical protein VHH72_09690 [Solirubrobacterales bacterium]|jgi:acetyl esterase/lipase|nr:hypothetical protein [Solirubrobacterales bacterium]